MGQPQQGQSMFPNMQANYGYGFKTDDKKDNGPDKDKDEIKKFNFLYNAFPGSIFELSELNSYKDAKLVKMDTQKQNLATEIDKQIRLYQTT